MLETKAQKHTTMYNTKIKGFTAPEKVEDQRVLAQSTYPA